MPDYDYNEHIHVDEVKAYVLDNFELLDGTVTDVINLLKRMLSLYNNTLSVKEAEEVIKLNNLKDSLNHVITKKLVTKAKLTIMLTENKECK